MVTVLGDSVKVDLVFTSLEMDLLREIAFNTSKSIDQLVAERLRDGIDVEVPGDDMDYEFRYPADDTAVPGDVVVNENSEPASGLDQAEDRFRFDLRDILTELYNTSWSRGKFSDPTEDIRPDFRQTQVSTRTDMVMTILRRYLDAYNRSAKI